MMKIVDADGLLDALEDVLTPSEVTSRSERMRKAHLSGKDACEICGRSLHTKIDLGFAWVGQDCAKKLQKAGFTW